MKKPKKTKKYLRFFEKDERYFSIAVTDADQAFRIIAKECPFNNPRLNPVPCHVMDALMRNTQHHLMLNS